MKDTTFSERLSAARNAKQAMATKFLRRPGFDDPLVAERRAARAEVTAAREARVAERKAARLAEEARLAAERESQAAEIAAEQAAQAERAVTEMAAQDADRELKLKAARDARYAARKARR